MKNIIFIGKYSLKEEFQSAGAKRVLNQVKFLINNNQIKVITFSPQNSNYKFNLNLKTRQHKNAFDIIILPLYWIIILSIIAIRKKKKKNYLILESVVEIYSIFPIFFAKILGYKIIHDVVEDFSLEIDKTSNQKLSSLISSWFEQRIVKYCSGIIVISERLFEKFEKFNIPIIKLYNSVEKQEFQIINSSPKMFNFFYSGSFSSKDGVLDLIQAFDLLSNEIKNIHLNLTGKGYGEYYNQCIKKINNNSKISYFGYLPEKEMYSHIRRAQVLCVTRTNSEFANNGFPFKLAEYLSFGIPVLTTTVSDISLIFRNNDNVFFSKPGDINSIKETMENIISNYLISTEIGRKGMLLCRKEFSIEKIGYDLEMYLNTLE